MTREESVWVRDWLLREARERLERSYSIGFKTDPFGTTRTRLQDESDTLAKAARAI